MNSKDWYARQLGQQRRPAPAPAVPEYQPQQPGYQQQRPQSAQVQEAVDKWHGRGTNGQIYTAEAIQVWSGTQGAQQDAMMCPGCGNPEFLPLIAAASEGAVGVDPRRRLTQENGGRRGHCFYCGYREFSRGDFAPPVTGLGLPGARSEGRPRDGRGPSQDKQSHNFVTTRMGDRMVVDRSLVGRGT